MSKIKFCEYYQKPWYEMPGLSCPPLSCPPNLTILVSLESWRRDLSKFGEIKLSRDLNLAKIENLGLGFKGSKIGFSLGLRISNFRLLPKFKIWQKFLRTNFVVQQGQKKKQILLYVLFIFIMLAKRYRLLWCHLKHNH